ncbi:hypothetical protein [Novosphingobium sp. FKTRR1]|uniref:hypothetical protein n=1 Tax=Novosphingobium sp. FKTRR1 TaxID=2879118 RepID=UPI001CF00C1E|nr:hypothetical protein [Novosphingobium sp. FKTRR1]
MSQPDDTDQPSGPVAADGRRLYPTANTLADFVRMIENGQFDADVSTALRDLAADMEDQFAMNGTKLKADVTLKIGIVRDPDGFYRISGDFTVKKPKLPRKSSLAWLTPDNLFTPNMPRQGALFGTVRDVTSVPRNVRN